MKAYWLIDKEMLLPLLIEIAKFLDKPGDLFNFSLVSKTLRTALIKNKELSTRHYYDIIVDKASTKLVYFFQWKGYLWKTFGIIEATIDTKKKTFLVIKKKFYNKVIESYTIYRGKKCGAHKWFHDNGNIKEKRNFNNGIFTGKYVAYDEHGHIKEATVFDSNDSNKLYFQWFNKEGFQISSHTYTKETFLRLWKENFA